jgi:hypothetical protein
MLGQVRVRPRQGGEQGLCQGQRRRHRLGRQLHRRRHRSQHCTHIRTETSAERIAEADHECWQAPQSRRAARAVRVRACSQGPDGRRAVRRPAAKARPAHQSSAAATCTAGNGVGNAASATVAVLGHPSRVCTRSARRASEGWGRQRHERTRDMRWPFPRLMRSPPRRAPTAARAPAPRARAAPPRRPGRAPHLQPPLHTGVSAPPTPPPPPQAPMPPHWAPKARTPHGRADPRLGRAVGVHKQQGVQRRLPTQHPAAGSATAAAHTDTRLVQDTCTYGPRRAGQCKRRLARDGRQYRCGSVRHRSGGRQSGPRRRRQRCQGGTDTGRRVHRTHTTLLDGLCACSCQRLSASVGAGPSTTQRTSARVAKATARAGPVAEVGGRGSGAFSRASAQRAMASAVAGAPTNTLRHAAASVRTAGSVLQATAV